MKSSTKWLIGFGAAVALLVVTAVILVLTLPGSDVLPPEDMPEGIVMRYFKALEERDYRTAYTYLSKESLAESEWLDTYDEWIENKYYPGQTDTVWKAAVVDTSEFESTASIEVEISSFEPNVPLSNPVYSYRQLYTLEKTDNEWKIKGPLDIPWEIR